MSQGMGMILLQLVCHWLLLSWNSLQELKALAKKKEEQERAKWDSPQDMLQRPMIPWAENLPKLPRARNVLFKSSHTKNAKGPRRMKARCVAVRTVQAHAVTALFPNLHFDGFVVSAIISAQTWKLVR
eukprot:4363738-Amphidinium_carterae.1